MSVSCAVILDLIPLVKDNVASEDSAILVTEHAKSCESCKREFESHPAQDRPQPNDKRVVSSIKKKLFFATSLLILLGAFIGMAVNSNSSSLLLPILGVTGVVLAGVLFFIKNRNGDSTVERFFVGRAIGTLIVFGLIGVYLFLKYVLRLF